MPYDPKSNQLGNYDDLDKLDIGSHDLGKLYAPPSVNQRYWRDHQRDALKYMMAGVSSPNANDTGPDYSSNKLLEMIGMRLHRDRKPGYTYVTFSFIMPYKNNDMVVVFLVHNGQPTYIEDEWGLFPSDALITKLRLLLG